MMRFLRIALLAVSILAAFEWGTLVDARAADSRLRLGADLSYASIEYLESPGSINSVQGAVRAGASLDVRLKDWVGLSLSGSVTSLGFLFSPAYSGPAASSGGDPTPSFWEGALRAPFSVLKRGGAWDLRLTPGVSGWGMWVPDEAFGVRYLIEPQFRLEFRRRANGSRKWGFHVTGAVHSLSGSVLKENRLIEAGADFQLNSGKSKRTWSLMAGYRDNAYVNDVLSMTTRQWMLGVAIQW